MGALGVFYIEVEVAEMNRIAKVKCKNWEKEGLNYNSQRWEEGEVGEKYT